MGYIAATITSRAKTADMQSLEPERKKKNWLPWLVLGGLLLGGGGMAMKMRSNYVRETAKHYRNRDIGVALASLLGLGGVAAATGALGHASPDRSAAASNEPAGGGGPFREILTQAQDRNARANGTPSGTVSDNISGARASVGRLESMMRGALPSGMRSEAEIDWHNRPGPNTGGLSGLAQRIFAPNLIDNAISNPLGLFRDRPSLDVTSPYMNPLGIDIFNSNRRY